VPSLLSAAGALISLRRRWLPDPAPEVTGGAGGPDPDKGKAAGARGSPGTGCVSRHIGSGYLAPCFDEGVVQSTVGSRICGIRGGGGTLARTSPPALYPAEFAVATAPNAVSRVEKATRRHLMGPDWCSISKSSTSLTPTSGEHSAASTLVVVSVWEWNRAPA
jgi:hypothetical protein